MQFCTLLLSVLVLLAGCAQDNKNENRLTQTEVAENEDAADEKKVAEILSESDRAQAAAYAKAYAFVKKKGGSDDKARAYATSYSEAYAGQYTLWISAGMDRGEAHNNALHFTSCYMAQRDAGLSKKKRVRLRLSTRWSGRWDTAMPMPKATRKVTCFPEPGNRR